MSGRNKKYFLISTDFGLRKGGIQIWAYYIIELLKFKKFTHDYFYLKNISVKEILKLIRANFSASTFILMDWKKLMFVLPSILLFKTGLLNSRFFVFVLGDEILNLGGIRKWILNAMIKNRDIKFISDSNEIGRIFEEQFGRKIDYNCYPFIDIEGLVRGFSLKKVQSGKKIFFTVSRLAKRKNVASVVSALALVKKKGISFEYYIAGSGPETDNIRKWVESCGLSGEVFLLGNISEEEKISYLNRADLFLLPSLRDEQNGSIEGFGIVFIEANAFGVPVISGNTGGMLESVIDGVTGFHCDGSVEDIADKILKFIEHDFSREAIVNHAKKFDYRNQDEFIGYIS